MSNLPQTAHPLNGGRAENPYNATDFFGRIDLPSDLHFRDAGPRVPTPIELDRHGIPPIVRYVWIVLDLSCSESGKYKYGCWKSNPTYLDMIREMFGVEYGDSSLNGAFKVLESLGLIARRGEWVNGTKERMIWCLWRFPFEGRNCLFNLGGVKVAGEELSPVPPMIRKAKRSLPPESAKIRPEAAINCGRVDGAAPQKTAEDKGIELRESNVNVNDARAGGDGEPVSPPVESPVTSPTDRVEAARAAMRDANPRWAATVARHLHDLVAAGHEDEVRAWLGRYKLPELRAEPIPGAAPEVRPADKPPAPAESGLKACRTDTLLNRLIEVESPEVERIVKVLADRWGKAWGEEHSVNCFKSRLRMVARQELSRSIMLRAVAQADKASPGFKGMKFNEVLKPHLPGKLGA